jgi:hypothetical protein
LGVVRQRSNGSAVCRRCHRQESTQPDENKYQPYNVENLEYTIYILHHSSFVSYGLPLMTLGTHIDYIKCEDRKKDGELKGDIGAIR